MPRTLLLIGRRTAFKLQQRRIEPFALGDEPLMLSPEPLQTRGHPLEFCLCSATGAALQGGAGGGAKAELERVTARLQGLRGEHQRLVAEREWLNASLLEFESGPSADEQQRSGHS